MLRRYPVESIAGVVSFGMIFVGFAFLGRVPGVSLPFFQGELPALATLYCLWMIVITTTSVTASQVSSDAATGTLETFFMCAHPPRTIFAARAAVSMAHTTASSLVLLLAFAIGTKWLPTPGAMASIFVGLGIIWVTGLGFGLLSAGLALLWKRTTLLLIPINFLFILAVMGVHARDLASVGTYMPFVGASALIRAGIGGQAGDSGYAAVAALVSAAYLALGAFLFGRCEKAVRAAGKVGVY
jgi:ABC-2 type transport system permease protein